MRGWVGQRGTNPKTHKMENSRISQQVDQVALTGHRARMPFPVGFSFGLVALITTRKQATAPREANQRQGRGFGQATFITRAVCRLLPATASEVQGEGQALYPDSTFGLRPQTVTALG